MQARGPGTLRFVNGVRKHGFLQHVGELWQQYGDVFQVRIGSRVLLFAMHPDAVDQVTISGRAKYDKRKTYDPVRKYLTGEGLVASTGSVWRNQRKLLAPFFTPKGIRSYADVMIADALKLQERWRELASAGCEVELAEEMTSVTASIILRTMFGTATMESMEQMRHAVETMISFVNVSANGIAIPLWIPTERNRKYSAARDMVHQAIAQLIEQRKALPEERWPDDLLSKLMRARDEAGEPMSEDLLRDEAITTFFAGHETTARTMTFAWHALAHHPHVADRIHEEVDRVLADRVPSVEDLFQLPYTLRVVKEVLRLYPAAPFYARDAIEHDRIGGFDVAPGTAVMLSPYYSHRHPDFWEDPELFDPDRWTRERETNNPAYHPFGAGQRVCIGNSFSLLESHLLLAILGGRFTPRLRTGYETRWEMQGVLGLAHGLPAVIVAR